MPDKLATARSVPSKIYRGPKVVAKVQRSTTRTRVFPYQPPAPVIGSISPPSGNAEGGTAVTITGQNFLVVTSVMFGSTPASSFSINSSTSITAIAPVAAESTVSLTVANSTGISNAVPFSFYAQTPAMKMVKSVDQTLPTDSTNQVTGFSPASSYPNTRIVSDRLVVPRATAGKLIQFGGYRPSNSGALLALSLMKNSTVLATINFNANGGTITGSATTDLAANDTVWLQGATSFGSCLLPASVDTFVSWEQ